MSPILVLVVAIVAIVAVVAIVFQRSFRAGVHREGFFVETDDGVVEGKRAKR